MLRGALRGAKNESDTEGVDLYQYLSLDMWWIGDAWRIQFT